MYSLGYVKFLNSLSDSSLKLMLINLAEYNKQKGSFLGIVRKLLP